MSSILDRSLAIPRFSPVCAFCRHRTGFRTCEAFDDQIPLDIWVGQNSHQRPYPGDHGIQFESVPGAKVTRPQVPVRTA